MQLWPRNLFYEVTAVLMADQQQSSGRSFRRTSRYPQDVFLARMVSPGGPHVQSDKRKGDTSGLTVIRTSKTIAVKCTLRVNNASIP